MTNKQTWLRSLLFISIISILFLFFYQYTDVNRTVLISMFILSLLYYNKYLYEKSFKKNINPSKQVYYTSRGLTSQDITYFRSQMAQAKQQIITIEQVVKNDRYLTMLFKRYNHISLLKNFFKTITSYPEEFNYAGKFIFKLLPQLHEQVKAYPISDKEQIALAQKVKQRQVLNTIEKLIIEIETEYHRFNKERTVTDAK